MGTVHVPFQINNDWGWLIRGDVRRASPGGRRGIVIVAPGFKGFKDWGHFPYVCERIAADGFTAISLNFSGNGVGEVPTEFTELQKFRRNTLTREIQDLGLVLEQAGKLPGVTGEFERPPALLGHSRGGLVALVVASRNRTVGSVVTWAGVGLLRSRFPEDVRSKWRQDGVLPVVNSRTGQVLELGLEALDDLERHLDDYDPVRVVESLTCPLLLVHGEKDLTVPMEESQAVFTAARSAEIKAIAGGDHTFGAVHPFKGTTPQLEEALASTLDFLGRNR